MTLTRMREIVAAMRSPEGWAGGIDEMNEAVFLLADIAGIDAPDVDIDAMTERALAAKAVNMDRVAGVIAFLRTTFYNDGAEGESVHRVCADAEALAVREQPAAVLTLLARLRRAEAALRALSPAR